jgi:AraC family transcriptional activator of pobA
MRLIRERLLLEAKRLLVYTSMKVSEIAYALNFEDPAYFSRFFRRLVDRAPGDFREEFSEKHQT